ncbi:MAG: hypothetical protein ACLFQM_00480 [Fidelibacterota bacterium]
MNKNESRLANIGCLSVIVLVIIIFLLIPKTDDMSQHTFEIVSRYEPAQHSNIYCVYTDCETPQIIENHALKLDAEKNGSIIILYYNKKNKVPDISESGFVVNSDDRKNAIAIYKRYGSQPAKFTTK